jgi:murein DD-endopeptidase MepM/ murein hydrolase activator NlpD
MDAHGTAKIGQLAAETASVGKSLAVNRPTDGADVFKRQQAAQEFASLLFLEVLKAMRAALPQEGALESESLSRDIYNSMLDVEIAKAMAKRDTTGFLKTVESALAKAAPEAQQDKLLKPPIEGQISSLFGARNDPLTYSGRTVGYGNMVELEHGGGVVTRHAHDSGNLVAAGGEIRAGQPIASVGSTGRSTGAHLHFEVLRSGVAVNPASVFAVGKGGKFSSVG